MKTFFEYLDEKDVISEQQADNLEQQMDNKRDDVVEKMENMNEASTQRTTNSTSENPNQESSEEDMINYDYALGFGGKDNLKMKLMVDTDVVYFQCA